MTQGEAVIKALREWTDGKLACSRRCPVCGRILLLVPGQFHRDSKSSSGFSWRCAECACRAAKEWASQNKERRKIRSRRWYEANRLRQYANNKRAEQADPERYRRYHCLAVARYQKRNKENIRDKHRIYKANYKARRRNAVGRLSAHDVNALWIKQGGKCEYCEKPLLTFHLDHKLPLSRGGRNDVCNIALSCPRCNCSKKAQTDEEFRQCRQLA